MTTFKRDFESISIRVLQDLVDTRTIEDSQLEYKQEVGHLVSLAEEICAFANTTGGDLFVGITEEKGEAIGLVGINTPDIDREILRYSNAIIGNTDPALTQLKVRAIRLDNGNHVIHFRINRSFSRPHMITANNKFPIRVGNQKMSAGITEIRRLFSEINDFQNLYERFRSRRIEKALNVYNLPTPAVLIHYVPLSAFEFNNQYPVIDNISKLQVPVLSFTGSNPVINVDGVFNRAREREAGFTQIFRNGIIELGSSIVFRRNTQEQSIEMLLEHFVRELTINLERQLRNYSTLGMRNPFYLIVNMIGCRGVEAHLNPERYFLIDKNQLDDDFIQLPELWLDPSTGVDLTAVLSPLLRTLWNAFGLDQ
ncbi:helix-turn-helix domain-containing protein [Dehalobacter sp. 4CP]|uniref:AlbA family DNA-binding domain-containing protein n=1 Tax=Dehalobacter sp. CP TaxID=2594474 RepID=UPI0039EB9097